MPAENIVNILCFVAYKEKLRVSDPKNIIEFIRHVRFACWPLLYCIAEIERNTCNYHPLWEI